MEILTFSTIVILAATSAIFGAATLLLGKEIKNIRGQLWSQGAQSHLGEQEKIKNLEICPPDKMGLVIQGQTAIVETLRSFERGETTHPSRLQL